MHVHVLHYIHVLVYIYVDVLVSEFLITSYGSSLTQRASYLALCSSLFWPDGAVNYDYIVTNTLTLC